MARRTRSTSKKREAILAAAARVFIHHGYDRASMDHIAQEAAASKRTVYNHFSSKDELFREVLDQFLSASRELKQIPYEPGASLEDQLGQFADAMLAPAQDPTWRGLMKVITTSPAVIGGVLERLEQEEDTLAQWLRGAVADERLWIADPVLAARAFWAMLSGAFLMPAIFAAPPPPAEAEALKHELVQMFLARYARPPS